MKFLNIIERIDIFGVPIPLLTQANNQKFQSTLGGILSILLGSISLAYFLYIVVQWSNNLIPPNVSSKQKTISYTEFSFSKPLIQITLQDLTNDIDPFRKDNNIITPLLYTIINSTILKNPIPLFSTPEYSYQITLSNGSLVLNNLDSIDNEHLHMKQYLIVLTQCSNSSLLDGGYCADKNIIEEYLSKFHGLLFLTISLGQINQITRELEVFNKQYYTSFDTKSPIYSQIMLKQQETIIDDGILFNNYKRYNTLNNYEMINQQIDNSFASRVFTYMSETPLNLDNYGCYLFRIDNISIVEEVTMPKLGQILAQIGSIVQLLFLLKFAALYYNSQLLEDELLHDIISMYYPDVKGYSLKNFLQKQLFQEENNKKQPSIQSMNSIHKALLQSARKKCRLNNIIYEISRIQFIIQQQFGIHILKTSHLLGEKFESYHFGTSNEKETNRFLVKPIDSIDFQEQITNKEPLELLLRQF
ncbi:unnamed protein product [Paramecium pentaurelia]|uniref:Uncharacterized protein n=1 Tax=Paramecium pentaurelia TaxID=43138 RepID=A0A8S1UCY3_9CILI|nr:unnamed protein product [Paramecium pentaurelia]